jgi:aspartate oxidase
VTDLVLSETQSSSDVETPVCLGATVYNTATKEHRTLLTHKGVTLASGGLAGIYTHSTNPPGFNALGSSAALALRSKHAKVQDLEYVQFHPTALKLAGEPCFLLSEALRGEGAKLTTSEGNHFATSFHPDGELAPRDIVARGVYAQSQTATDGNVYLDISHRDSDWLRGRFPSIYAKLKDNYGLDFTSMKIPITPAAHYTCGGIVSDEHGRTSVANLYVAGEAARTGLHGGNRLASTSLLEALVWGASVGDYVGNGSNTSSNECSANISNPADTSLVQESRLSQEWARDEIENLVLDQHPITARTLSSRSTTTNNNETIYKDSESESEIQYEATQLLNELKSTMWNKVGVVRTPAGLREAAQTLENIQQAAETLYQSQIDQHQADGDGSSSCLNVESIMVRDASYAGLAVAESALRNKESAGAHYVVLAAEDTTSMGSSTAADSDNEEDEQDQGAMVAAAM